MGHKIKEHDDVRDKVGQAIGNLQALDSIEISTRSWHSDDDEVVYIPSCEVLAAMQFSLAPKRVEIVRPIVDLVGNVWMNNREMVGGLATVFPGTPPVDSAFSVLKMTSGKHSTNLSDFSLESKMHSKLFLELQEIKPAVVN
jgi:hypothetical protein